MFFLVNTVLVGHTDSWEIKRSCLSILNPNSTRTNSAYLFITKFWVWCDREVKRSTLRQSQWPGVALGAANISELFPQPTALLAASLSPPDRSLRSFRHLVCSCFLLETHQTLFSHHCPPPLPNSVPPVRVWETPAWGCTKAWRCPSFKQFHDPGLLESSRTEMVWSVSFCKRCPRSELWTR